MFNLRLGGIAAGLAFILSLLTGLLSGTALPALILRPVIFAVLFFVIVNLITLLVNRFLPELLDDSIADTKSDSPDILMPGSNINIMEDNPAAPGGIYAKPDSSEDDLGNIDSLSGFGSSSSGGFPKAPAASVRAPSAAGSSNAPPSTGLDQSREYGYTEGGSTTAASGDGGSLDMLADLESLAGAFSSGSGAKQADEDYSTMMEDDGTDERTPVGNQPKKMDGDFDPKQLAEGIRTILKKDEG